MPITATRSLIGGLKKLLYQLFPLRVYPYQSYFHLPNFCREHHTHSGIWGCHLHAFSKCYRGSLSSVRDLRHLSSTYNISKCPLLTRWEIASIKQVQAVTSNDPISFLGVVWVSKDKLLRHRAPQWTFKNALPSRKTLLFWISLCSFVTYSCESPTSK